jgi:replicative DNA helicase
VAKSLLEHIEKLSSSNSPITGISTGYSDLDEMTSGMQRGDLIIVAGRPSMGKTTFAMNIAEHVATREKLPVAIFSMEMPAEQLTMRMFSSLGRIEQQRLRTGKLNDEDWPRVAIAVKILSTTPLFIDDGSALSPTEVRARARRLMREHGQLGLIVVDYLQLMQTGNSENRTNEISEISRSLKALAKELSVPVIALSQLNRGLEQRSDKRPIMSDLRESGAIEQDADVIIAIYRESVYNKEIPEDEKNKAEILIRKQRNGPIGEVYLTFLGHYNRFENYAPNIYTPGY